MQQAPRQPAFPEFIAMMALTMSLVALSIDTMLPALGVIGDQFRVASANTTQYVIYVLFAGLAVGQLVFGPLADSIGRKRAIYAGLALFAVGSIMTLVATRFETVLAGRLLQGLGAAGPRIISVAIVRDLFAGRQMARVMSFIISIFILVPALAPSLGQWLMNIAGWQSIFLSFLIIAGVIAGWFATRQPETLRPADRQSFRPAAVAANFLAVMRNRQALGYTLAAGLVSGPFIGFLGTAQQIFQDQYGVGQRFALYFALLALSVGVSTLINGRLVVRLGMRRLSAVAVVMLTALAGVLLVQALAAGGQPPLPWMMANLMALFLFLGFLFGNLNALAMEPLGAIAGTGAAVVGAISTLLAAAIGAACGALYDGTLLALPASFVVFGSATAAALAWAGRGDAAPAPA